MPRNWFTNTYDLARNAARIDIYGDIGASWYDDDAVSARDVLDFLGSLDATTEVELHVNSGGGSVFDAFAIMTALRNHPAHVTAYIDGLAASAASYLVAAADEVVISSVAWMMIHQASGLVIGNSADMRQTAEELDRIDGAIANIYKKRAGNGHDFAADMAAETWYDAEQAVAVGLADRIEEAVAVAACVGVSERIRASAPAGAAALMAEDGIMCAGVSECICVSAPVGAAAGDGSTPVVESDPQADDPDGQEVEPGAQERAVEIGGNVYLIEEEGE